MKRSAPYPTFRYWLNDDSEERLPIAADTAKSADGLSNTAIPSDGQVLIGSVGNEPVPATLTAGAGIAIDNAPGSITVSSTLGALPVQGDGELLIGSSGNPVVASTLTGGEGITVTNAPGSITISQNLLAVTKVSSDITDTTTSLTDVVVAGMSITPGEGDFLVFFDGKAEMDNDGANLTVSVYHNGVQIPNTEQSLNTKDTAFHIGASTYVTGVLAGETIEIRWRVDTNSGFFYNRSLIAVKLAS